MQAAYSTGSSAAAIATLQAQITALQGLVYTPLKVSLTSAQILTLGTNMISILPSPGVGKIYTFSGPIIVAYNFVTTGYATNTNLSFGYVGGITLASNNTLLTLAFSRTGNVLFNAFSNTGPNILSNAAFRVFVAAGNPTAGDGTIDIYLYYKILTL